MITQSVTCHPAEVTLCSDDSLSLHGVRFRKHKRTVWGLSVCLSRRAYAQSDSAGGSIDAASARVGAFVPRDGAFAIITQQRAIRPHTVCISSQPY